MSPLTETERTAYARVDEALRSYPLAPAPRSLAANVLAAIAAQPRAAAPPFRIGWIDLALSAFGAGMLGVLLLLGRWALTPQGRLLLARLWLVVELAHLHLPAWFGPLMAGLILALAVLAPLALLFTTSLGGGAYRARYGRGQ